MRFRVRQIGKNLINKLVGVVKNLERIVSASVEREQYETGDYLLAELRQYPGPVKYPILWKSERQRRAFFASNGFGRGIPTQRTNALRDGWKLVTETGSEGARLMVTNLTDYEQYVTGNDQQPFHTRTGWNRSEEIIERWGATMIDRIDARIGEAFEVEN